MPIGFNAPMPSQKSFEAIMRGLQSEREHQQRELRAAMDTAVLDYLAHRVAAAVERQERR